MDFESEYSRLLTETYNGKVVTGKPTITKIKSLNIHNRKVFIEFHNYFYSKIIEGEEDFVSYKGYRSKILDFLLDDEINSKSLTEISQADVESYFRRKYEVEKPQTYNSRISYVQKLFDFIKLPNPIAFYLIPRKEEIDKTNPAVALTITEIESIRKLFKNQYIKLFCFEMLYQTDIILEELKECNYSNFNNSSLEFVLKNRRISVPSSLLPIIENIKGDTEYFNVSRDYNELIKSMRQDIIGSGIRKASFKPSDIWKTVEEVTHYKCVGCGNTYEAIADNWCLKQFEPEGSLWLVCRFECGEGY
ncbi:hypothetical protein ACFSO0_11800 [Brevibacillus sp. GCM10020057]|uniref:hypothetical protein n=1 Tax=Brevibacillus sp. GCM10020057 TaxID=3317327 RepID=UPI003638449B